MGGGGGEGVIRKKIVSPWGGGGKGPCGKKLHARGGHTVS